MLLSIVIPVYNVEKYIHQCLDSVLSQDYTNFEVILVDDGSTDSSGLICDAYAKKDKRIQVIHQQNGGLSAARNSGLKIAKGDYIWFIDSDDWIVKNAINIVVEELKKEKVEMLGFSMIDFNEAKQQFSEPFLLKDIETTNGNNFIKENGMFYAPVWCYIYKKSFILSNNLTFKNNQIHEDDYFNLKCFSLVKHIKKIRFGLYFYRRRENSIISSKIESNRIESYLNLVDLCKELRKSDLNDRFIENQLFGYVCSIYKGLNTGKFIRNDRVDFIREIGEKVPTVKVYNDDSFLVKVEKKIYSNFSSFFYVYINYLRKLRYFIEAFIYKLNLKSRIE